MLYYACNPEPVGRRCESTSWFDFHEHRVEPRVNTRNRRGVVERSGFVLDILFIRYKVRRRRPKGRKETWSAPQRRSRAVCESTLKWRSRRVWPHGNVRNTYGHILFEPIVRRRICVGPKRIDMRLLLVLELIGALWIRREPCRGNGLSSCLDLARPTLA